MNKHIIIVSHFLNYPLIFANCLQFNAPDAKKTPNYLQCFNCSIIFEAFEIAWVS